MRVSSNVEEMSQPLNTEPGTERVELLTVSDCFWLGRDDGYGVLVLLPDFSVPPVGWKNRTETIIVVRPDGIELERRGEISLQHFNISDPHVSVDRRWRIGLLLTDAAQGDAPVGSKILVSRAVKDALLTERTA